MRSIRALLFAAVLALLAPPAAEAQVVRGTVVDADDGAPLTGVSVVLRGTGRGTVTNRFGRYELRAGGWGALVVAARAVNYREGQRRVVLTAGDTVAVDFRLEPVVIELAQVEVAADRQAQGDPQPSMTYLQPRQARRLPGAAEDVLRSLQATPGVLAVSDYSSQLVVRGGGPDQNLVLLDDVEVFNPYRLYGVVSMFNPAVAGDIRLLTGGFPARYGDRLSSVLDVTTRAPAANRRLSGSLNTSIVNTNLVLEGGTGFWNGGWMLTGRRTYYDVLLGLVARRLDAVDETTQFPRFADVQGALVLRPARNHRLRLGGILARDALDVALDDLGEQGADADRLAADDRTTNDVAYLTWHWTPRPRLHTRLTTSWYRNSGDLGSDGALVPRDHFDGTQIVASLDTANVLTFSYDQRYLFTKRSLQGEAVWQGEQHLAEIGGGFDLLHTTLQYDLELNDVARAYFELLQQSYPNSPGAFPDQFDQGKRYYRAHAFAQDRLSLWEGRVHVQPGLRLDYYRIIDRAYLSPRLHASLAFGSLTTVRAAWGRYLQSPGFEKLLDQPQAFDLSDGGGVEGLRAEEAFHYVLGVSRWLDDRYLLRVEGYYKTFDDLIVQDREQTLRYRARYVGPGHLVEPDAYRIDAVSERVRTTRPVNAAEGRAYGLEVMLEKRYGGTGDWLSGWLAYSYAHAERLRPRAEARAATLRVPFAYDRRHVLDLVLDARLGRGWSVGATLRYGTGFPYTPAVDYAPIVVTPYDTEGQPGAPELLTHSETGEVRFEVDFGGEDNLMSARLPDYHRLDVRLSRELRLFGLDGRAYIDVLNVYNRRNTLGYRFVAIVDNGFPELRVQRTLMFPLLPTFGFHFTF